MSAWSASATFLAGTNRPLLIIERLMSSITTVAARVESSVRNTSKSSGTRRTGVPGPGPLRVAHLALELVHLLELLHESHRLTERQLLVAAELVAAAQLVERQEVLEVPGELGQRGFEALVLHEERAHQLLKLSSLAWRHALEERLHLRHLPAELREQIVEALGAGEELTPLVFESLEVGLLALRPLAEHPVQVLEHLAQAPEILGRHPLERLLHALEEGLEHLRAERLHELVEQALRLRIHEVVALQLVDLAGRVRRKRVELGELLLGRLAGETVLDPLSLLLDDVGELLLDVLQCGAEIVAVELLLPPLPELLQEILEPRRPLTLRMLEALLEQAPERAPGIAVEHEVVGHRGQEIVGVEVRDRLRAVPARVADQHGCVDYRACRILRS